MNSFELTCEIAKILDSKKGEDIKAIRVQELTSIGDYFVIASGANVPQVKAMSDEVEEKLSKMGLEPKRIEGYQTASWIFVGLLRCDCTHFPQGDPGFLLVGTALV